MAGRFRSRRPLRVALRSTMASVNGKSHRRDRTVRKSCRHSASDVDRIGNKRPSRDAGVGAIATGFAMLARANALHTLIRRRHLTPSCGGRIPTAERNPGPGKDVHGELDHWPGIREQPGSIVSVGSSRHPAGRDSNAPKPDPNGLRLPTGTMCHKRPSYLLATGRRRSKVRQAREVPCRHAAWRRTRQ
jgi:hypothetical protein